jgi:hypothetical protein
MRTSFHHQPEAQHPNFQLPTSWQADYPIFRENPDISDGAVATHWRWEPAWCVFLGEVKQMNMLKIGQGQIPNPRSVVASLVTESPGGELKWADK